MYKFLQKIGKSLLFPVAILPAAAIFVGLGNWVLKYAPANVIGTFLYQVGIVILDQLPLLFAIGVAYGMSKDHSGASAIAGIVAFFIVTKVPPGIYDAIITNYNVPFEDILTKAFSSITNAFTGILSGIIAAVLYNRFSETKLPQFLGFFSGKRFVPIITAGVMAVISIVMLFIWPIIFTVLVKFGDVVQMTGAWGAGVYGFFNRLLIPFGLHHALNAVFWFDISNINDLNKFLGNAPGGVIGETGRYLGGFFPIMMFGLPAAAIAMIKNSKKKNRAKVASLMGAAAFAAFFTGVTEPIEFSFMFIAPILYVVHALLTGISVGLAAALHWINGFSFSAGFVDFILNASNKYATNWYMLLVQGVIFFVIYYFVFDFCIRKFNLLTPGRGDDDMLDSSNEALNITVSSSKGNKTSAYDEVARRIYEALGGKDNISELDFCATRIRVEINNSDLINENEIKRNSKGLMKLGKKSLQIIIGTDVQFVAEKIEQLMK